MSAAIFGQTPSRKTADFQNLAKWRSANYSDVRYKLNITLEKDAPRMNGTIEIRVNLTAEAAKNDLVLDWRARHSQNDKVHPYAFVTKLNMFKSDIKTASAPMAKSENGHLILPKNFLKTGENVIEINFASPIKPNDAGVTRYIDQEDGAEYIYAQISAGKDMPFPVFDQPNLKARFDLEVLAPKEWEVVSNTNGLTFLDKTFSGWTLPKNFYLHSFRTTNPISTYVFAFAAGEFARFNDRSDTAKAKKAEREKLLNQGLIVDKTFNEILTGKVSDPSDLRSIYVRKSQAEKFKQHAAEVFRSYDKNVVSPKLDIILLPEIFNVQSEYDGIKFVPESAIIK